MSEVSVTVAGGEITIQVAQSTTEVSVIGQQGPAGPIGGADKQVLFNDHDAASGDDRLTWNKTTGVLAIDSGAGASVTGVTKAMVDLGNADNTSDVDKPVSTAQAAAITVVQANLEAGDTALQANLDALDAAKQPLDADLTVIAGLAPADSDLIQRKAGAWTNRTPAQFKTDLALVKGDVGLANADNTSDVNKPISTAVQAALDVKADLVAGLIPTSQLPTLAINDVFTVASEAAMLALVAQRGDMAIRTDFSPSHVFVLAVDAPGVLANWKEITAVGAVQSVNGQTGVVVLGKGDIGLANADNTSDANKPVSTAQQAALDLKAPLASPTFTGTVGGVSKGMVGLGNVDNTSDVNKPVSTAQQAALDLKVSKDSNTGAGRLPAGTTAQRPAVPAAGDVRWNNTLNQYEGYTGTAWAAIGGGATGAPGNSVFVENDQHVTGSYTLTAGKNAMSAGPITIDDGVTVTVPTGAVWSIV